MKFFPKKLIFAIASLMMLFFVIAQPKTAYQAKQSAHNFRNISPDSAYQEFQKTLALAKMRQDSARLYKKIGRK